MPSAVRTCSPGASPAWWGWADGKTLESQAVAAGRAGHHDAMRAHTEGKKTRGTRGRIVAVCAAVALVLVLALTRALPGQAWLVFAVAGVLVLARHGRPACCPIVQRAVVPGRYAEPSQDIILDALSGLGIPALTKAVTEGRGVDFMTPIHRDGPGWCVQSRPAQRRHRGGCHRQAGQARLRAAPPAVGDAGRRRCRTSIPAGWSCGIGIPAR